MPTTPIPIPLDDLTFGIELEVLLPAHGNRDALAALMTQRGITTAHEVYNHANRPHWKVTTDQSIGYHNAEVVSPILQGPTGFDQIRIACDALESYGCRVSRATGFHVHVGVQRFAQQLGFFKELAKTYAKFEPILDQLVAPSRRARNNNYCLPAIYTPEMEQARTLSRLRQLYGGDRFRKLNLEAYAAHGTVEFRQHQGTTNADKVTNWVKLCLRMVQHAAKNTEPTGDDRPPFRPPPRPQLPPRPVFPEGQRDYSRGIPLTRAEIPRFARTNSWDLRQLVIARVAQNHHGPHTEAYRMLEDCRRGEGHNLRAFWDMDGSRTWLGYFADRGELTVVRASQCPELPLPPEEQARRAALITAWEAERDRLEREWQRETERAREAYNATIAASQVGSGNRPLTDDAPATLEGLLELVGAAEPERQFFTERQMELNS